MYEKMIEEGWDRTENVMVCFGRLQDVIPVLVKEGLVFDGVLYDTFGKHFTGLEDCQGLLGDIRVKPGGVYSFLMGWYRMIFFHCVGDFSSTSIIMYDMCCILLELLLYLYL